MRLRHLSALAVLGAIMSTASPLLADEGMWLFNAPPLKQLKENYNFEPTKEWLEHLQKSSVRFNSGGSGSFVSKTGLVMTNHHVGADDLQKLSTQEKNYLRDGFHAKTNAEELRCKGLELNVLQSIKIVTDEVNGAVKMGMAPAEAFKARQGKIGEIEKAAADPKNNIRADVVTLFAGGQYHLYIFKKYTDIRLVFAPEKGIAFFGGDPDNFEYPRFDLDVCFFRVYENDKPITPEHHLTWSEAGTKPNDLIFVSGHPGRTTRQNTIAELQYQRDTGYPALLSRLNRLEVLIGSWVERSEANRQKGEDELFGIQNSRKARIGGLGGLLDPKLMDRKVKEEERLKKFLREIPVDSSSLEFANDAVAAFEKIAAAEKVRASMIKDANLWSNGTAFNSSLFGIARTLVRAADEKPKAARDRLPEFGDSRLPSLEFGLFSDEPHYADFETLKLADSLTMLVNAYPNDELVKKVLAGKSPRDRAFELISSTKVGDVAFRKKMYEGGKTAIDEAKDPMLELAKLVDTKARDIRKKFETQVDEPKRQAYSLLAKARYMMDGDKTYPDATFTLRLSYGTVKGYKENGKDIPAYTDFTGLYERSKEQGNKYPFELPKRWDDKKAKLDMKTPFNFVSTADIIGGNSGSPVVNQKGEVVGLIFDGNIQSLVLDFIYDDTEARALSVDSRGIIEALAKVYDADGLVKELTGK
ncbi:MAG: S46 family peptidase [Fimbriiglobus sp.]